LLLLKLSFAVEAEMEADNFVVGGQQHDDMGIGIESAHAGGGSDRLLVRQLLAGEDVANPADAKNSEQRQLFDFAKRMVNFQYIVADRITKEAIVVDAAYDPEGTRALVAGMGLNLTAFVATHYHFDHIGGSNKKFGVEDLPGLAEYVRAGIKAYVPQIEAAQAVEACGLVGEEKTLLHGYDDQFVLALGGVRLTFHHTPGHSPGSMVIVGGDDQGNDSFVITGDTVFPGSCGRIDLPDSDKIAMYHSLQSVVAALPDALTVYPGHGYSGKTSTIGREKVSGLLRPITLAEWKAQHSA
jgi:glyoxylase-like metal-dependent hydrolase (beta-lactamase superfamily II)